MPERIMVNFFYCHPVGHAVEALRYCLGYHAADPERRVGVVLNAATAVELATFCPFVSYTFAIDHPLFEPCRDSSRRLSTVPREWERVLDEFRRHQPIQRILPPFAPMIVPARVILGDMTAVGLIVAIVLDLIATAGRIVVAARAYERSILRTGAPIKLRRAVSRAE